MLRFLRSRFNRLSISAKLVSITVFVCMASTFLAAILIFSVRVDSLFQNELSRIRLITTLVADFSQAPLTFGDKAGAGERLTYLNTVPEAVAAAIFDADKQLFAQWRRVPDQVSNLQPDFQVALSLWESRFTVVREITAAERVIGHVVILAETRLLREQVFRYLGALLIVAAVIMPLAALLAIRVQRVISGPIMQLAQAARQVTDQTDYRLRVTSHTEDEIGDLCDAFNDMIVQVRAREAERDAANAKLLRAHTDLEKQVRDRTCQLTESNTALENEVAKLKAAELVISQALSEKETLLREVHHRVKNNLQVISSLLSLQMQGAEDEKLVAMLGEARQRIQSISLVHETLYGSPRLSGIPAGDFLSRVVSSLAEIYRTGARDISVAVSAGRLALTLDEAMPLGLIVNELVTNAFKYAFTGCKNGQIIVSLDEVEPGALKLRVADDGIGFPETLDDLDAGTLGLKLVQALAVQLRGEVRLIRDSGSAVEFVFTRHC